MTIINSVVKGKEPQIDALNVTPSTSAQTITASGTTDGYSPVNVSAVDNTIDANITAGNIKDGVTILGVTGNYTGNTPTGTMYIISNGTYNVSDKAIADVQVPTTAPNYYIEITKDAGGYVRKGNHLIDFSTFTDVGSYTFAYAYRDKTSITGTIDLSGLTMVSGANAFNSAFYGCSGLTSADLSSLQTVTGAYAFHYTFSDCIHLAGTIDLSSLTKVSGQYGCYYMFLGCTDITSVDLSSLKSVEGQSGCHGMFQQCTSLTSINLSSLQNVGGSSACAQMFDHCSSLTGAIDLSLLTTVVNQNGCNTMFQSTAITSVDLSSLVNVHGTGSMRAMFLGCANLASVDISHLVKINNSNSLDSMFKNCTSLTELSFNNLAYTTTNLNTAFGNMLSGTSNVTVHFPAEWQTTMSSWANVTNGFGGTNTTVLFDLPNITTLDLSPLKEIIGQGYQNFANNNYFSNITSVNLSSLTSIAYPCSYMFKSCTNLTSVNLSGLKYIQTDYQQAGRSMFEGCTGLTSIDLSSLMVVDAFDGCQHMFSGCTGITSVNLSSLVYTGKQTACQYMFGGCTGITNIHFDSLKKTEGPSSLLNMFYNCTGLTDVYFPAITGVIKDNNRLLNGCTNVTVHLPSNFSITQDFGGTNTTVLKDLPAVVILTGANTVEYERNPKYDTATALAWRVKDTGTASSPVIDWTPYYTSGLTDPQVSDTIYSDSACTVAVTTIDSIA